MIYIPPRIDIRDLRTHRQDRYHLSAEGVDILKSRIQKTVGLEGQGFQSIVSDSVLVAYARSAHGWVRTKTVDLGGTEVDCQMGCGFAWRDLWADDWQRFLLPDHSRVLVVTAGNDLLNEGHRVADEVRERVAYLQAKWRAYGGNVDILVVEDDSWPLDPARP
jgi:hypothetical protein